MAARPAARLGCGKRFRYRVPWAEGRGAGACRPFHGGQHARVTGHDVRNVARRSHARGRRRRACRPHPQVHASNQMEPGRYQLEPGRTCPSKIVATNSETVGSQYHSLRQSDFLGLQRFPVASARFRTNSALIAGERTGEWAGRVTSRRKSRPSPPQCRPSPLRPGKKILDPVPQVVA